MSERTKRRLQGLGLSIAILVMVIWAIVPFIMATEAEQAVAQPGLDNAAARASVELDEKQTAESLDPVLYSRIQTFREQAGLTNADLAAAGLTRAEAETVLVAVKTWIEQNQAAYDQRVAAISKGESDLRKTWRNIHTKPRDITGINQIESREVAIKQAKADCDAFFKIAFDQITGTLSREKSAVLNTARQNASLSTSAKLTQESRYVPSLASDQANSLAQASRRGRSAAVDVKQRSLSFSQRKAVEDAKVSQRQNIEAVLEVEQAILLPSVELEIEPSLEPPPELE